MPMTSRPQLGRHRIHFAGAADPGCRIYLLSYPVEILAWVFASTSGLTRTVINATVFSDRATCDKPHLRFAFDVELAVCRLPVQALPFLRGFANAGKRLSPVFCGFQRRYSRRYDIHARTCIAKQL
jgi:hypothetical protein